MRPAAFFRTTGLLLLLALVGAPIARPVDAQDATPCPATTVEANEALVRRYWGEVWTAGGDVAVPDLLSEDEVHHWGIGGDTEGVEAFVERLRRFLATFPDIRFAVGPVLGEGDLVASRWTATATHRGEWQGIAPTGRAVAWTGINVFRIECGRIAESWGVADHAGLLRQLGSAPPDAISPVEAGPATPIGSPRAACPPGSRDENVAVARRWTEEVLNDGNLAALDEIVADDVSYDAGLFARFERRDDAKRALGAILAGFPGIRFSIDGIVAEGDLVAVRWTGRGTHTGEFLGIAPTGRRVEWSGINIYRIACGRIVEGWSDADGLGLRRQLGALPATGTPAA